MEKLVKVKIASIGSGNMGAALMRGAVKSKIVSSIGFTDISAEKAHAAAEELNGVLAAAAANGGAKKKAAEAAKVGAEHPAVFVYESNVAAFDDAD